VGIILFELLVGVVPFDGDTPIAIGLQHARAPIPAIRSLNPAVPKNLESAVAKALQKAPESRYRSAKSMLNDLKAVRESLHAVKEEPEDQPAAIPDISEAGVLNETEPALLTALRRTLLAIVAVVALVSALLIGYVWMRPGEITVPDMLGKTLTEAQQVANANHFQIAVKSEQFNDDYAEGTVYYMNPAGGRSIKAGKVVDVWISKGSRYATVPDCIRLATENARERIAAAGLNVGEISQEYSKTVPAGSISKQVPSSGKKVERGQPVNLVMSLGPDPTSEIPEDNAPEAAESGPAQSFDVKFTVPRGRDPQPVRIVVADDSGENVVYSELMHPGDKVSQTVQGTGKEITIRVYIADKLIREEHSR
jgi:serine/threonine-protein kinase